MLNSTTKRFILPFSTTKSKEALIENAEKAAIYALAELGRAKGSSLILKLPPEKLLFITKMGYPLWVFLKNDNTYIFDCLKNSDFTLAYFELPTAKGFLESMESNSQTQEDYMTFLLDHNNYFERAKKEKMLSLERLNR